MGKHAWMHDRLQYWLRDQRLATHLMKIRVECYSGHRGEEEPRAFLLGERRLEVRELLDRWLGPSHRYFKVRIDGGDIFILRHDEGTGEWELAALVGPESSSVGPAVGAGGTATRH